MNVIETEIPEVKIIEPKLFGDARGYFFESWNEAKYREIGIDCNWVQDNESRSRFGVLRGLHFQAAPYTQAKLVRVISGAVLDVALDIRKGSRRSENTSPWNFPAKTNVSSSSRAVSPTGSPCSATM